MPKKTKRPPSAIRWEFPRHIPTIDFFEGMDLDGGDLVEAIENFIFSMEGGTFLTWEAVVSREQGLRLTRRQKGALDGLVDFGDSGDEEILYIDDLPRPSEPWYAILNRIASHILVEPFRTWEVRSEITSEGWDRLVECLVEHAGGLSLPAGTAEPLDAVTPELRHKMALQSCFTELEGFGQEGVGSLEREREFFDAFIDRMRASKESVAYLDLSLDSLLRRLVLPERDKEFLVKTMMEVLGIKSAQDRIADHL